MGLLAQAVETVAVPALLQEAKRIAESGNNGPTSIIYLFVVVLAIGAIGGFFVLRYMLTHAREIHSEANKTLLEISSKHETRCTALTDTFSAECSQLRQVILRIMSDARDMVHAARDIAGTAVNQKELLERLSKAEADVKAKRDRDSQLEQ